MSASAARRCTAPNAVRGGQPGAGSERGGAPAPNASSPAGGALLVATACANSPAAAPDGRWTCSPARWSSSLRTRACRARRCGGASADADLSRGAGRCGASRRSTPLRRPHGGRARSLCRGAGPAAASRLFDQSPIQLIGEVRRRSRPSPGRSSATLRVPARRTANLFAFLDANRPWRKVSHRASHGIHFAVCMRNSLTSISESRTHPRRARQSVDPFGRCVLSAFPPSRRGAASPHRVTLRSQARQLALHSRDRIGVLAGQCLHRRIQSYPAPHRQVAAKAAQPQAPSLVTTTHHTIHHNLANG